MTGAVFVRGSTGVCLSYKIGVRIINNSWKSGSIKAMYRRGSF